MKSLAPPSLYVDTVTIIVPVKDEEEGLSYLLDDFEKSDLKNNFDIQFIFVIDVRTSDSSKTVASIMSENIIDQSETTGKGAAMKQAVLEWYEKPTKYVVFLDADGSYSFNSVQSLLDKLVTGPDIVSGSRFLNSQGRPDGMSRLHNIGNLVLSKISSIRNRRKITDLCTGLWGFTAAALQSLEFISEGFDLEAEIAGLARKRGLDHQEIPVNWSQRKGGVSKLSSLKDGSIILLRILTT